MPTRNKQVKQETRVVKINGRKIVGRLKATELSTHGRVKDVGNASLVSILSDNQSRRESTPGQPDDRGGNSSSGEGNFPSFFKFNGILSLKQENKKGRAIPPKAKALGTSPCPNTSMKTIFVGTKSCMNKHAGEFYDEVVEVENAPTTDTIDRWASAIMATIRKLSTEDKAVNGDGVVRASLDGPTPYNAILMNLQIILKAEGIVIELPYLPADFFANRDGETMELFEKIGEKG